MHTYNTAKVAGGNVCKRKSTRDIDTLCKHNHRQFFSKTVRVTPKKLILVYLYTKL